MNDLKKIWGIVTLTAVVLLIAPKLSSAQGGRYISDQEFYDNLQPYGTWVSDEKYGNVWVPDADEDFRPYATRGHWVLTRYGNTWVSDYPWGWATFHYGRWRYDDYLAGNGFQATIGLLPGLGGAMVADITVGRLCSQVLV